MLDFLEFVGVTCEGSSILSWPIPFLPLKSYNMNLTNTTYGAGAPWHRNVRVPVDDSPNFCDAWSCWGLWLYLSVALPKATCFHESWEMVRVADLKKNSIKMKWVNW